MCRVRLRVHAHPAASTRSALEMAHATFSCIFESGRMPEEGEPKRTDHGKRGGQGPVGVEEGLALGDFVLVVREAEVAAARVEVRRRGHVAKHGPAKGRALDVPPRPPAPQCRWPACLCRVGHGLPQREVAHVLLLAVGTRRVPVYGR